MLLNLKIVKSLLLVLFMTTVVYAAPKPFNSLGSELESYKNSCVDYQKNINLSDKTKKICKEYIKKIDEAFEVGNSINIISDKNNVKKIKNYLNLLRIADKLRTKLKWIIFEELKELKRIEQFAKKVEIEKRKRELKKKKIIVKKKVEFKNKKIVVKQKKEIDNKDSNSVVSYKNSCYKGDSKSCLVLGDIYSLDEKTKNNLKAFKFYTKACDFKLAAGCYNLGFMYHYGKGVEFDIFKAINLYSIACDGGDSKGCLALGYIYFSAQVVERNYKKARDLFQLSCESGEAVACRNLGEIYNFAKGVKQDSVKAESLFYKACDGGDVVGCSRIGLYYVLGKGVKQDLLKANQFFKKGCYSGDRDACRHYKKLQKHL